MAKQATVTGSYVHPTAEVSQEVAIGEDTCIWNEAQIGPGASIGHHCIIGKSAYVDRGVRIGDHVKVHNRASIYRGVTIEDGAFVGAHVTFSNDKYPRCCRRWCVTVPP